MSQPVSPLGYVPLVVLTRGEIVESLHYGALAVVDSQGRLLAAAGDPMTVTFLRSTAKPFQAMPLVEDGGMERFGFTEAELALMCASHSGTDEHVAVAQAIQRKVGVTEADLLCGVHPPYHQPTALALHARGEEPTPNRHNCSGKHSGMLAQAVLHDWPTADYIAFDHPVQQRILETFAAMCGLAPDRVAWGVDGCSAPNFAVPLYHAAWAYARLVDPYDQPPQRAAAARRVAAAMMQHPFLVAGPERFDTLLMEAFPGRVLAKGGAEGYQGLALPPGSLGPNSPGLGIAIKIADGDPQGRARSAVALETLRQLGFWQTLPEVLARFAPVRPIHNWRRREVGQLFPLFRLR